ncbi:MAG: hypothetical protein PHO01_08055, partial [Desulfotomaculaceae bacterium]|nr:hypothetical protein [Desulfotomaculaceae bacterium]
AGGRVLNRTIGAGLDYRDTRESTQGHCLVDGQTGQLQNSQLNSVYAVTAGAVPDQARAANQPDGKENSPVKVRRRLF